MRHWFVHVKMLMRPFALALFVQVLVMFVMDVRMSVDESFVLVEVPVSFPIEKEHSRKHDQRRHPVLTGRALSEHDY